MESLPESTQSNQNGSAILYKKGDKVSITRGKYKGLFGYFLQIHESPGFCWVEVHDPTNKQIKVRNNTQTTMLSLDQIERATSK